MGGRTGYPDLSNSDAFGFAEYMEAVEEHFDALIDPSVPTASDLPNSGNWPGRTIWVESERAPRGWDGSGWVPMPTEPAWINFPTPTNGFTAGTGAPQYRLFNGVVQLRGELLRTAAPTTRLIALTIPVGFRPASPILMPMGAPSFSSSLAIGTDGSFGIDAQVARASTPGWTLNQIQYAL